MDALVAILTPVVAGHSEEEILPTIPACDGCRAYNKLRPAAPRLNWDEYEIRRAYIEAKIVKILNILRANHLEDIIECIKSAPKKWAAAPYGYPYRFLIYCWRRLPHSAYVYLTQLRALCVLRSSLDALILYTIDYVSD